MIFCLKGQIIYDTNILVESQEKPQMQLHTHVHININVSIL